MAIFKVSAIESMFKLNSFNVRHIYRYKNTTTNFCEIEF